MNHIDQAIILDEARKYTDSQRLAYSISNTMTFNGNPTGKDCIDDFMVKISDKTLTNEEIESITMYDHSINGGAGGFGTITKEHLVFSNNGSFREIGDGDVTFAVIVDKTFEPGDGSIIYKGTYVMCAIIDGKMYGYVSEIKCFETIHHIDPKFLPPVDSITMNGADGKQYKLTVSGGALNIAEVV